MLAAGMTLAPMAAFAQSHADKVHEAAGKSSGSSGGGNSGGGSSAGSGGSGGSAGSSGGHSSGGSSSAQPSGPSSSHAAAVARADNGNNSNGRNAGRERDGRPVTGQAVARQPGGGGHPGHPIVPGGGYWGGYYPWGWGGLGLGGYYAGYYDPWYDDYPGYGGGYYAGGYEGSLRIKVKPREAEVYVDGYFAGQVDDFDGTFQSLKVESGPHRIEVRAEGYEPLFFDVRIQPDRTITYTGELKKVGDPH